jgi:small subunit ribosomal protein S15
MALDSAKKAEIIKEFGNNEGDTGATPVQIALLTQRVKDLTEHLKINKKDHSSRLGLLKLVGQRRALMKYLRGKDYTCYKNTITKLGIRDNI